MKKNVKNAVVELLKIYKKQCLLEQELEEKGVKVPMVDFFHVILILIGFPEEKINKEKEAFFYGLFSFVADTYLYSYDLTEIGIINHLERELKEYIDIVLDGRCPF